jgi:hypothetical protein
LGVKLNGLKLANILQKLAAGGLSAAVWVLRGILYFRWFCRFCDVMSSFFSSGGEITFTQKSSSQHTYVSVYLPSFGGAT